MLSSGGADTKRAGARYFLDIAASAAVALAATGGAGDAAPGMLSRPVDPRCREGLQEDLPALLEGGISSIVDVKRVGARLFNGSAIAALAGTVGADAASGLLPRPADSRRREGLQDVLALVEGGMASAADEKRAGETRSFVGIVAVAGAGDDAATGPLSQPADPHRWDGLQDLLALLETGFALVATPPAFSEARLAGSIPPYLEGVFAFVLLPLAPKMRLVCSCVLQYFGVGFVSVAAAAAVPSTPKSRPVCSAPPSLEPLTLRSIDSVLRVRDTWAVVSLPFSAVAVVVPPFGADTDKAPAVKGCPPGQRCLFFGASR